MSLSSRKATPPDWLYAIVVVWAIDKLLDGVYAITMRKVTSAWHWMVPRVLSFAYLRAARLVIWLMVIEGVTHTRQRSFKSVELFMLYSLKGFVYQSEYSEKGKAVVAKLRSDLDSRYPRTG